MRTLLLDADGLMFEFASTSEQRFDWGGVESVVSNVDAACRRISIAIEIMEKRLHADQSIVCLSCPTRRYWRHDIYPQYKAHRTHGPRPVLLPQLREHLQSKYRTFERPNMEADDVLGILATGKQVPGEKVIVSGDKDMRQIPGLLYNRSKPSVGMEEISEEYADRWHLMQALVGDTCDGYPGCKGIGPKKAEAFLDKGWAGVVAAFVSKGLTEADALLQARVSRICRSSDYDFKKKEVILWQPSEK